MVQLSGYTLCCGADILCGFDGGHGTPGNEGGVVDPRAFAGYKTNGFDYARDANGQQIPLTYADKFKDDFAKKRRAYPNRMYSCILNQRQYDAYNKAWPKLLKEIGFEFVRRWNNSSHDGSSGAYAGQDLDVSRYQATKEHPNYFFVLCTADRPGNLSLDNFTQPPKGWAELSGPPTAQVELKAA